MCSILSILGNGMTAMQQAISRRRRSRRRSGDAMASFIEILATPYKHRPSERASEPSIGDWVDADGHGGPRVAAIA